MIFLSYDHGKKGSAGNNSRVRRFSRRFSGFLPDEGKRIEARAGRT